MRNVGVIQETERRGEERWEDGCVEIWKILVPIVKLNNWNHTQHNKHGDSYLNLVMFLIPEEL